MREGRAGPKHKAQSLRRDRARYTAALMPGLPATQIATTFVHEKPLYPGTVAAVDILLAPCLACVNSTRYQPRLPLAPGAFFA